LTRKPGAKRNERRKRKPIARAYAAPGDLSDLLPSTMGEAARCIGDHHRLHREDGGGAVGLSPVGSVHFAALGLCSRQRLLPIGLAL